MENKSVAKDSAAELQTSSMDCVEMSEQFYHFVSG